ncbi:hypothetical protein D9758_004768 [Tetrapyrgos nigripes]|uniref:Uncharacterized protein n=1 Tax=Tetrapyrgos nigripes TaxID=182062 RepID=A0A8H5LIZ1_9AGAR|nr:hypothetical protein D9758_004768 [Tetrapyrgos nigripes]
MKIEWNTDAFFHTDGSRRARPKASTMHGWLAKMRGTLLGDETLRSQGIREMKEAKAVRQYYKQNPRPKPSKKSRKPSGSSSFYFFGGSRTKSKSAPSRQGSRVVRHNSSSHRLVGRASQRSTQTRPRASRQGSSSRGGGTPRARPSTRRRPSTRQ